MNTIIDQIRNTIHQFTSDRIVPYSTNWDQAEMFPIELWKELGSLGLLGITIDSDFGGCGLGLLEHCAVMEEISYASPSVGLSYAAHSNLCANIINTFGTPSQKQQYLPKLCTGENIGSLAISESEAGSDAFGMNLNAKKTSGGYILNGSKYWITNAPIANTFVVYAKTTPSHLSVFIVEKGMQGFDIGKPIQKIGMKSSPTAQITFDHCFIPENNILGHINEGLAILKTGLNSERLILSSGPLGIMRRSLDETIKYSNMRHQFGRPINQFQRIQDKISLMYTSLISTESMIQSLAKKADSGQKLQPEECAATLLHASTLAIQSAEECLQTLGGNGYTIEYGAGQRWVDAKLYDIGGGTKEIRHHIISKALIKKSNHKITSPELT